MSDKIIYEKKYSPLMQEDFISTEETGINKTAMTESDSESYFKKIFENTVMVMIPERIEGREMFIDATKEMGEFYQIDTVITEHDDRISATYSVDCGVNFRGLKKIISLADDLNFRSNEETVLLTLIYYTHATYRSGRKISPPHELCFGAEFPI